MLSYRCLSFSDLSLEELYAVLSLRQEVFVVEQHCPYQDADGRDAAAWHVLGMDEKGRLATYARIFPPAEDGASPASIGRVITAPFARGKGYGRELMTRSIEYVRAHCGPVPIKISAQSHLQAYYQSVGFERTDQPGYLEDGIPHVEMEVRF